MFYKNQNIEYQSQYKRSLELIGSLSNLFSDSKTPYLYYRVAEKIFCNAFTANDLSRGDISFDASKDGMGIGLKTFLENNKKTMQKVAEFNKDRALYKDKNPKEIVEIIAYLRNERIRLAQNITSSDTNLYHCIVRDEQKFKIFEEPMKLIEVNQIHKIEMKKNSIWFNDGESEYSFNLSKSTLLKRFYTENTLDEFEVNILDNPLEDLKRCLYEKNKEFSDKSKVMDSIYLPLYGKGKIVSKKSSLNQWNASGRKRDINEIYIQIPAKIHKLKPSFFPSRDVPFILNLPNQKELAVKVCQDNRKALMSNPNKALGEWLLREVLRLKEEEVLTYQKLQIIGIDSVKIDKYTNGKYGINFSSIGSYEEFIDNE